MNDSREIADALGLDAVRVEQWRQGFRKLKPGSGARPKGKLKRRRGMLSVRDCFDTYGIKSAVLSEWREMGMPFEKDGTLILVEPKILEQWITRNSKDLK